MALHFSVAFDDFHRPWKTYHFRPFFPTSRRHIYFNTLRNDGSRRGVWDTGNHTVVLSLVAKVGIVGGSRLSTCF